MEGKHGQLQVEVERVLLDVSTRMEKVELLAKKFADDHSSLSEQFKRSQKAQTSKKDIR